MKKALNDIIGNIAGLGIEASGLWDDDEYGVNVGEILDEIKGQAEAGLMRDAVLVSVESVRGEWVITHPVLPLGENIVQLPDEGIQVEVAHGGKLKLAHVVYSGGPEFFVESDDPDNPHAVPPKMIIRWRYIN